MQGFEHVAKSAESIWNVSRIMIVCRTLQKETLQNETVVRLSTIGNGKSQNETPQCMHAQKIERDGDFIEEKTEARIK